MADRRRSRPDPGAIGEPANGRRGTDSQKAKRTRHAEAWGKNAAYHFVFTRQNRVKLDGLTNLVERGLVKPVIGAFLPLARMKEAHEWLEGPQRLRGKVAIDVAGETVVLPLER